MYCLQCVHRIFHTYIHILAINFYNYTVRSLSVDTTVLCKVVSVARTMAPLIHLWKTSSRVRSRGNSPTPSKVVMPTLHIENTLCSMLYVDIHRGRQDFVQLLRSFEVRNPDDSPNKQQNGAKDYLNCYCEISSQSMTTQINITVEPAMAIASPSTSPSTM
jgi:hypothetical protein